MTQNSISALQAAASLQQAASSGQQAVSTGGSIKVTNAKTSVSFTVLAANTNTIVMQDNANKQRINLPIAAVSAQQLPKSGDTLLLVSANDKQLSFRVLPANSGQINSAGQKQVSPSNALLNLPPALNRPLVESWPDINIGSLGKAGLPISAQTVLNSTDPAAKQLAKILTQNALKLGQPLIDLPVSGKVTDLSKLTAEQLAANVKLSIATNTNQTINVSLPIPKALSEGIKVGDNLNLLLSPNSKSGVIKAIALENGQAFKNTDIQLGNRANPQLTKNIQQISEAVLFSGNQQLAAKGLKAVATSSFVQPLQNNILSALPKGFSAQLKQMFSPQQMTDARIVISTDSLQQQSMPDKQHQGAGTKANPHINLMVLAKPQIIQIDTASIAAKSTSATNALLVSSAQGGAADSFVTRAQQTQPAQILAETGTAKASANSPASSDAKIQVNGALLSNLKQQLASLDLPQISGKIQQALNQSVPHLEPSAALMQSLKTQLESIANGGSSETRALLKPILQQINTILNLTADKALTPTISTNNALPFSDASGNLDSADNSVESDTALPELLRSMMSSQALMRIGQAAPIGQQNSFIEGLVNLLKLSLASKLATSANGQTGTKSAEIANQINAFAANIIKQKPNTAERYSPARTLQDLALGDSQGRLIGSIGKLLSAHNVQKLRSAEAALQGQDTCYYSLPNILSPESEDIQIVIKREHEHTENDADKTIKSTWKLDMKLDIGKYGTVLAKTQLRTQLDHQGIDLHFYASNEALKNRITQYLPLLNKRLESLGIQVDSEKCDVGKLDASLFKTQLNVMHAYA